MMKPTNLSRISIFLILLSAVLSAAAANVYQPKDLPNPNIADRHNFIADPGGYLSPGARNEINRTLDRLRESTTAEVAVAIVPSIGDRTVDDFAPELFKQWGIGKKDNNNGVLLLVAMEQKKFRIETGYGMEGILPDISAATILRNDFVPYIREGDVDAAVGNTVNSLARVITDPEAAAEIRSQAGGVATQEAPISSDDIMQVVMWVAFIVACIALTGFIRECISSRKKDRYHSAIQWKSSMRLYWIAAILSVGLALPIALLALWKYRRTRNKPLKCRCCGGKMHKLSEEEDNTRLSPSEDLEERLDTIDYDVWECPDCGAIDKYAFPKDQTQYTKCPRCGTVAMRLVHDFTKVPPTYRRAGVGERVYECKYCGNRNNTQYTIPKKENGAGAAAALGAAAILSGRGSSGGGGGFSGGGFGGGMSGGGGASGGW